MGHVIETGKLLKVENRRGRIALGDLAEAGQYYTAEKEPDGTIVLTPVVIVPRPPVD